MNQTVEKEVDQLRLLAQSVYGADSTSRLSLTLSNPQLNPKDNSSCVVLSLLQRYGVAPTSHFAFVHLEVRFSMDYPQKECQWSLAENPLLEMDIVADHDDAVLTPLPTAVAERLLRCITEERGEKREKTASGAVSPFLRDVLLLVRYFGATQLTSTDLIAPLEKGSPVIRGAGLESVTRAPTGAPLGRAGGGSTIVVPTATAAAVPLERGRRHFFAVVLPRGEVAFTGGGKRSSAATPSSSPPSPSRLPEHVRRFVEAGRRSGGSGIVQGEGQSLVLLTTELHQPLPTSLRSPTAFLRGANVGCDWTEIVLVLHGKGKRYAALSSNIALCERIGLPEVARLLMTLEKLWGGCEPPVEGAYLKGVLLPILQEAIDSLTALRQSFWSGVAVCCLLLSEIRGGEGGEGRDGRVVRAVSQVRRAYEAVQLVEKVFSANDCVLQTCEARQVREALLRCISSREPTPTKRWPCMSCAVCGLRVGGDVSCPLRSEGALVMQCVYCGHGGHAHHIKEWWSHPQVISCPGGCDCRCLY